MECTCLSAHAGIHPRHISNHTSYHQYILFSPLTSAISSLPTTRPPQAQDDETGVLNVSPAANTLNLVLRDEGLMKFVKYLSAAAPSSRFDIAAVYKPEPDSDDEEEEAEAAE